MNFELGAVDKYLVGKLRNDAQLTALVASRVYSEVPPENGALPFVVVSYVGAVDRNAIGAIRIFTEPLYLVKAVTKDTSLDSAHAIVSRIDTVLQGSRGVVGDLGISVQGCYREMPVRYTELVQGVRYNHVGGRYRLFVCKWEN